MTACAQFRKARHSGVHAYAADCVSAITSSQFCFSQIRNERNNLLRGLGGNFFGGVVAPGPFLVAVPQHKRFYKKFNYFSEKLYNLLWLHFGVINLTTSGKRVLCFSQVSTMKSSQSCSVYQVWAIILRRPNSIFNPQNAENTPVKQLVRFALKLSI